MLAIDDLRLPVRAVSVVPSQGADRPAILLAVHRASKNVETVHLGRHGNPLDLDRELVPQIAMEEMRSDVPSQKQHAPGIEQHAVEFLQPVREFAQIPVVVFGEVISKGRSSGDV